MTDADLRKIADDLGEPIEIVREMSDAIACCAAEGEDAARADRRQSALEAYHDAYATPDTATLDAVETAIETAARVRVDADITQAAHDAEPGVMIKTSELRTMIEAAFRAAGFEVEK